MVRSRPKDTPRPDLWTVLKRFVFALVYGISAAIVVAWLVTELT